MVNETVSGRTTMTRTQSQSTTSPRSWRTAGSNGSDFLEAADPAMQMVVATALQVAPTDETILILGETGVGKDVMARRIHEASLRSDGPFVSINCAALPEGLLESELFGHMRGAYTGAVESRPGLFEAASGGTIFLDEIGELSPRLQAKLLHVLQEKRFCRVGGREPIDADVRIVAATNQNLDQGISSGAFRRDLFYRLSVVSIRIPALRERPADIANLGRHFARRYATLYNRAHLAQLDEQALAAMLRHSFDGNVRELENLVKRAILMGSYSQILDEIGGMREAWTPEAVVTASPSSRNAEDSRSALSLREVGRRAVADAERRALIRVLTTTGWNRRKAATILRTSYRSMLYKIREYSLMPIDDGEIALSEAGQEGAVAIAVSPREGSC